MTVYIDSNIFIYVALRHPEFGEPCKSLLQKVQQGKLAAATSVITLCEVHNEVRKHIGKDAAEIVVQSILSMPLTIFNLDLHSIYGALHQVREHNLKINDAVHFAVALSVKAEAVYSYDRDFEGLEIKRVKP